MKIATRRVGHRLLAVYDGWIENPRCDTLISATGCVAALLVRSAGPEAIVDVSAESQRLWLQTLVSVAAIVSASAITAVSVILSATSTERLRIVFAQTRHRAARLVIEGAISLGGVALALGILVPLQRDPLQTIQVVVVSTTITFGVCRGVRISILIRRLLSLMVRDLDGEDSTTNQDLAGGFRQALREASEPVQDGAQPNQDKR